MTTTQIKRLVRQSEESTDKAEQRDIRTKLVALLNNVYVIEQLFYVARADADAQPALEIGLRNLFRECNDVRALGLRDGLFSETRGAAPWLDECNGERWMRLAK
jgi:hypothetical protein